MLQDFFSFSGRLNRKPYWLRSLVLFVVVVGGITLLALGIGVGSALFSGDLDALTNFNPGAGAILIGIVFFLLIVAVTIAGFSLAARRLHDRDKSAWWLLLFYVAPNFLAGDTGLFGPEGSTTAAVASLVGAGISIWGLVEIGFLKGTEGPNRFGEDPLEHDGALSDVFN